MRSGTAAATWQATRPPHEWPMSAVRLEPELVQHRDHARHVGFELVLRRLDRGAVPEPGAVDADHPAAEQRRDLRM